MTLAAECIRLAAERGVRLAVAESLTGGLLCAELVRVPGASAAVSGGVVAYATELKASLLGVAEERLRETGPVDALVAEQMARGVRQACALGGVPADVGLATTGVAGPDPDPQTGQAPGTVWLGISSRRGDRSVRLAAAGDREAIRRATVTAALDLLADELRALPAAG